jgi:hypothetical protein
VIELRDTGTIGAERMGGSKAGEVCLSSSEITRIVELTSLGLWRFSLQPERCPQVYFRACFLTASARTHTI